MMGQQETRQGPLFYAFDLETVLPSDHLLRGIDQFLDLSDARDHLRSYYSHTGRPSVDPELLLRMLIVGYAFGIRSERRLCEEVRLNLAYRWFCGLGLEDRIPDHSTFSKARTGRFWDSGILRHLFETVLRRCISTGLVADEGFAVDASIIPADANRQRGLTRLRLRGLKNAADELMLGAIALNLRKLAHHRWKPPISKQDVAAA